MENKKIDTGKNVKTHNRQQKDTELLCHDEPQRHALRIKLSHWYFSKVWENVCVLTDAGQQLIEPLFGEKRILQTTEVKFEDASHRVDVMIILIIGQRVVSWVTDKWAS